jgi:hypothetical protein
VLFARTVGLGEILIVAVIVLVVVIVVRSARGDG